MPSDDTANNAARKFSTRRGRRLTARAQTDAQSACQPAGAKQSKQGLAERVSRANLRAILERLNSQLAKPAAANSDANQAAAQIGSTDRPNKVGRAEFCCPSSSNLSPASCALNSGAPSAWPDEFERRRGQKLAGRCIIDCSAASCGRTAEGERILAERELERNVILSRAPKSHPFRAADQDDGAGCMRPTRRRRRRRRAGELEAS